MRESLIIGTRGSRLALWQTDHIASLLLEVFPGLELKKEIISTKGDRNKDAPLPEIGGKGLFTEELERAQLEGRIDLAVHSLKDLPTEDSPGLVVGAIPLRAEPFDALVSTAWPSLEGLPEKGRVGTSSLRRKAQLLAIRPDLDVVDLRGNVPTRVEKVTSGELDGAILASAGLKRLDMEAVIAEVLPLETMIPACGQGALAVQVRADDGELIEALGRIDDKAARAETDAERSFLTALGGGCQVPIGALARMTGSALHMEGCVCSLDGSKVLRTSVDGPAADPVDLGRRAAEEVLEAGAAALIAEIE